MRPRTDEDYRCLLCDSWQVILGVILVLVVAFLYRGQIFGGGGAQVAPTGLPPTPAVTQAVPTEPGINQPTQPAATATETPLPAPSATPAATATPRSSNPVFKLVFIPMKWTGTRAEFEAVANDHAQTFIRESRMDRYFDIEIILLEEGYDEADLGSHTLAADVVEFGAQREAGDRYIGITNGDIYLRGELDVGGWTFGPGTAGVVSEDFYVISAHELGHTFGLCDEYNYTAWVEEDQSFVGGCPNPYPSTCDRSNAGGVTCDGQPTDDGRASIMGPASFGQDYGFNRASLAHLAKVFRDMAAEAVQQ